MHTTKCIYIKSSGDRPDNGMKFDDGGRLTVAFLFALTVIIMYNKL